MGNTATLGVNQGVTHIDISNNNKLHNIQIGNNPISEITFANDSLSFLQIAGTNIRCIDLSSMNYINYCHINGNVN